MSSQSFLFRNFFEKHKNTPLLFKITLVLAVFFYVYGFAWFNLTLYWDAKRLSGKYAEMGFFTYSLLCIFLGVVFTSMTRAKKWVEDEHRARHLSLGVKLAIVPLFLVIFATVDMYRLSFVNVGYFKATVTATEGVKKELKWLLGSGYPTDQEVNIDPETLEWTFTARPERTGYAFYILDGFSPQANSVLWGERFIKNDLEMQQYAVLEHVNGQTKEIPIDPDWNNPRIVGYTETKNPNSYAICDLQVPLKNQLNPDATYEVLFNGLTQDRINEPHQSDKAFTDYNIFPHNDPIRLPPFMRIEKNQLVIRTNFIGSSWPKYCLINFPKDNPDYQPEPITNRSLANLVQSHYYIFFALIPELRSRIHYYEEFTVIEDASFEEWMEKMNRRVAFDFLHTQISGWTTGESY